MAANRDTDKTATVAVELRLDRIPRLYNSLDPSPFHERELETAADDSIVGSAEDAAGPIRLVVMLPEGELARPEAEQVPASIRHHFEPRRDSERRLLRGMWRRGRCKLLNHLARLEVEMPAQMTAELFRACNLRVVRWLGPGA